MCDRRGVVTIYKEREMGGARVSVRTRTVLVLSSLAPVPRLCRRRKVGGGRGALSFVFVASLSVRPQFGRWPSSTGSLLLSLFAVCLAFGSLLFILRVGGHRSSGTIVVSAVYSDRREGEEGGWIVPSFTVASLSVCLR